MGDFINLHVHDQFSLLDGATTPERNAKRAKELGQTHLGQTNHGSLAGAYDHFSACKKYGITPVLGLEAYVAPASRFDKEPIYWGTPDQRSEDVSNFGAYTHMTLFAQDVEGLRNLYRLHEASYLEGFYRYPRIDIDLLAEYNQGLIVTTGCAGGAAATLVRLGQEEKAREYIARLNDIFYDERLFLEVMYHGLYFDHPINSFLENISRRMLVPLLATSDSHYCLESDAAAHDAFLCIKTKALLADEKRFRFSGTGYHLMSYEEMAKLPLPPASISNTLAVGDMIGDYSPAFQKRNLMPSVGESDLSLRDQVSLALMENKLGQEYHDRARYELEVIEGAGFSDYFLVLADIVGFAAENNIMVGPARGSAGGSLVAFLLGITELDSVRHRLLFERFLSPARLSTPDIDIDIESSRRGEVIQYIASKYGADKVAQVITFGTIKAKAALKDANRVLGGEYGEGERLVGMVPRPVRGVEHPLQGLEKIRRANPEVFELAEKLEGLTRSTGRHAAAIIISPEKLSDIIPVEQKGTDDLLVTSYSQQPLEDLGFVKMDFLGLTELSVMRRTLDYINENMGKEKEDG